MRHLRFVIPVFLLAIIYTKPVYADTSNHTLQQKLEHAKSTYFNQKLNTASNLFLPLAQEGYAEAQYYLGLIYSTDSWQKKNYSLALTYLLSAADQNHAAAMWKIGQLYDSGKGVRKDLLIAMDWYRKSQQAERDKLNYDARNWLVMNNGNKVKDSTWIEQIETLRQQATQGNVSSQFQLGTIYDTGAVVQLDINKAFKWYKKAAANGNQHAMFLTGYFLCRGLTGNVDRKKADFWFRKSNRDIVCH